MRPRRPILGCLARPGLATLLSTLIVLFGGTLLILLFPGFGLLQALVPAGVFVAFSIGIVVDTERHNRRTAAILIRDGFEACEEMCEQVVESLATSMRPDALSEEFRSFLLTAERHGRTIYLANYWDGSNPYAFVAVQTARSWPEAIVRRKRIAGNLRDGHDLRHREFNRHREILSNAPAAEMQDFEHLVDWFVNDNTVRKSFRLHEIPGKNEQWSFREHWVALADRGHARPKQLLQLAAFLIAFAEAADALDPTVIVGPKGLFLDRIE